MSRTPSGTRAKQALLAVLPRSVDVRHVDAGNVTVNGQSLEIKWLGEGRLGEVRRLLAGRRGRPDVFVARRLSPGARAELADAGVGWVDETGAAEIAIGQIVVSRSGVEPETRRQPGWTRSTLAIAEAALCGVAPTVSAMKDATGLSIGSCVTALRTLSDLELLEATASRGRESARRVVDLDRLLDAYVTAAPGLMSEVRLEVGVTWRDLATGVRSAGHSWTDSGTEFAVTGQLGAELMAPYLTTVSTAEVYVSAETRLGLEAAAAIAGLKPIDGGRLVLRPFPSVSVNRLATTIHGLPVAPWPRTYVDLLDAGVRGEDAAEHLKDTIRER